MSIKAILILSIVQIIITNIPSALSCMKNTGYPLPKFKWKKSPDPWFGVSSFSRIRRLKNCECGQWENPHFPGVRSLSTAPAADNEYPWQALIRVDNVNHQYYCGGSLINDLFILTSCECVFQYDPGNGLIFNINEEGRKILPSQVKVWIGLTNRRSLVEAEGLDVQKIIYHPSFPKLSEADVALLKLKVPIKLDDSNTTSPICLPFSTDIDRTNLYKPISEVVGWFSPKSSNDTQNSLRKVAIITSQLSYKASCPKHQHDPDTGVQESFNYRYYFCTPRYEEGNPRLLYDMDTGSPLVVESVDNRKFQLGILSWISKISIKDKISKTEIATRSLRLFTRITTPEVLSFIDHNSYMEGASWCEEPVIEIPKKNNTINPGRSRTTPKGKFTSTERSIRSSSPRMETTSSYKTSPHTTPTTSHTTPTTSHTTPTTSHTNPTTSHTTPTSSHTNPTTSHSNPTTSHSNPTTSHTTTTTSHITPTTSHITPTKSHPTPTTSHITPTTSHPTPTTSHITPTTSHPTPTTSHITPTTSHPTPTTSHSTPTISHTSPTTPHISETTSHTHETTSNARETTSRTDATTTHNGETATTNESTPTATATTPTANENSTVHNYPIEWNDTSIKNRTIDHRCQCGRRSTNTEGRIFFGASDALPYEFPWQVLVSIKPVGEHNKSYCSGTVINSLLIMTSANCVTKTADDDSVTPYSISEVNVKVNVYTNENHSSAKRLAIDNIIVHPQYLIPRNRTFENVLDYDIALIKLQNPIRFADNDKISPICLPESQDTFRFDEERISTLAGWKLTNFKEYPLVLETMSILLHKDEFCKVNTWGSAERFLCGKGPSEDINSFSGGFLALQMQPPNVLSQIGIMSHKKTIWIKHKPSHIGYYSNVIKHLPFIDYISFEEKAVWCKRGGSLPQEHPLDNFDVDSRSGGDSGSFIGSRVQERKPWIWESESSRNKIETRICEKESDLKFCNCGRRGTTSSVKKGHQAVHFEFPWHVHLIVSSGNDYSSSYSCSASIINSIVLITSANCVINLEGKVVDPSLVTAEFLVVDDFWQGPKFSIDKIMLHPGYMKNSENSEITRKYDLALLKMKTPIEFKKRHYRPVCLPELGEKITLNPGTVALSLAWNRLKTLDDKIAHRLLKDENILHDANYCDIHLNTSSRTICADYTSSKAETIEVDYGKGIFLPSAQESHMMLIGIASFRISDNIRKKFELEYFTKIDSFVSFINYYSNEWGASWCQRKFSFS